MTTLQKEKTSTGKNLTDFNSYFDGLMLSDGCISKCSGQNSYRYSHTCKYYEWLSDIKINFISNGFNIIIYEAKPNKNNPNKSYNLASNINMFFEEQHKRWYYKDYNIDDYSKRLWHLDTEENEYYAWHKTIPIDINLTPECLINWYLGDGGIYKTIRTYHSKSFTLQLATCSFNKKEVEYITSLLNNIVDNYAHVYKHRTGYIIQIAKTAGIKLFFYYINNLEYPYCYNYKFQEVI